jgi:2-polyprenyl-3-methyl-5-hydroxy-6-metoxy-1,4-benzoquinol methylase
LSDETLARELAHHEELYSGFAQRHFAKPAVRELRRHMVRRILDATGAGPESRVLSLGCGIGDTELLLAPHVASVTGVDLSPAAIRQAREDAQLAGLTSLQFVEASADDAGWGEGSFDTVIGIFFLHHLPDAELGKLARNVRAWLTPGGMFYGLDPSRYRLSGALGALLLPRLMRRYQTPDEHELKPAETVQHFSDAGLEARFRYYDFCSTPLAGLLPSWRWGYRMARGVDELLIRTPLLRAVSSNFEVIARKPRNI